MAKKATLTPVTDTVNNAGAINTQLNLLNEKLDNTLSLDGSAPNAMQADIDLNNNDLINIGTINGSDATGLGPNLDAVAAISGDVAAVSAISADVVTNAANIVAIQNAAANAASAAADAISAAASFDSFDDRFLGSKVSEPTVDNDGDPLLEGAMYWNSTSNQIFIYDGVAFDTAAISSLNPNFTSVTVNGDISLQDNNKILLGGGNDLEIFHDGANSYINDVGTGSLYLKGSSDMSLQSATGENYFNAIANGATTLYYNNAAKIATNTSGVTVTGTVTADGLTVDTDTLHVDSANNWVGIGTNSPANKLEVAGIINAKTSATTGEIYLTGSTYKIEGGSSFGDLRITAPRLRFYDGATIQHSIDSGLHQFFDSAGSESMRIDSSGNVGIGTSSPDQKIHVSGAGNQSIRIENTNTNLIVGSVVGSIEFEGNDAGASGVTAAVKAVADSVVGDAALVFDTGTAGSASEAMRLSSAGRLYFNVTTDITAGDLGVQINGDSGAIWTGKNSTDGRTHLNFFNPNGSVGSITTTGSATAFNTSSDYRLKENVQPMTGASARVQALSPVNFAWKADGTRVDGFIAHELQGVVPEAVTGTKDAMRTEEYVVTPAVEATYDEDGNELTPHVPAVMGTREVPDYQGIDQSKLVPLLTAALQEALNKIDDLEARVAALESV